MKNDDRYPEGTTCSVCYPAGLPQPDYSLITNMDALAQAKADHLMTHMPTPEEYEAITQLKALGYPEPNDTYELDRFITESIEGRVR